MISRAFQERLDAFPQVGVRAVVKNVLTVLRREKIVHGGMRRRDIKLPTPFGKNTTDLTGTANHAE